MNNGDLQMQPKRGKTVKNKPHELIKNEGSNIANYHKH